MGGVLTFVAIAACFATLAVLVVGIGGFGTGKITPQGQNKLMRLRIVAQFIAVILIVLAVLALRD